HLVDVVGPVDQQAAPDHDGQHRDVDPVHPANGPWVLRLQAIHDFHLRGSRIPQRLGMASSCYFLSSILLPILSPILSCILSPILSPILLPILSCILSPILSVIIFSCILSLPILSFSSVGDEAQPTLARPKPRPTTVTAITCQILRMMRIPCLSQR